ncbi:MAG TPA: hypothetical protein VN761_09600 [Candidatus Polarisedimenticolia bacterium]|nr:hypothetical protein [Candidatus Polarisedimenticolia bacterium]
MAQGETIKGFFARLNPTERRFVVGVGVLFFLVGNLVWVWPHFGDWGKTKTDMKNASDRLAQFQRGTNKIPALQKEIEKYQKQGQVVPSNEQAVQFVRLIQNQASRSGVITVSMTPQRQATGPGQDNPFFVEQNETMTLQSEEKQLVDFLYNLGAGNSLIRVRSLSIQPNQSHEQLTTRVTLVASYQKKPTAAAPASTRAPAATPKPTPAPKPQPGAPARPASTPPAATPGRPLPHMPGAPGTAPRNNLTPNKK